MEWPLQDIFMLGSLMTALVVGAFSWRGRHRGWTESLASACVKSAVFWMVVFFATLPLMSFSSNGVQIFACSMGFALFSAIGSIVVAIFGPRQSPLSSDGPGLSPEDE